MEQQKYIGMDVHQATISVAVMDSRVTGTNVKVLLNKTAMDVGARPTG